MYEALLILGGAGTGYTVAALMMRRPGESVLQAIMRPLRGGGPGEERQE
jgi:hypothetical protein